MKAKLPSKAGLKREKKARKFDKQIAGKALFLIRPRFLLLYHRVRQRGNTALMTPSHQANSESPDSQKGCYHRLPSGIWMLGFVSMFMDISSELVHSLLPVFMTTVLGASMVTIGLLSKLVADTAPIDFRGTTFGIFNLVSGGAILLASVIAGSLWSAFGASAAFIAGASFAAFTAMGLLLYHPDRRVVEQGQKLDPP